MFDDAAAFRFVVPGSGSRVPDAASAFRLPAGSTVWYHGARDHYEGVHARKDLREVPADDWAAPPLTFRLPGGAGYAAITEAALFDYAGMMLQADGQGAFVERLGHAVPPSYPYTLRYGEENAKRLARSGTDRGDDHDALARRARGKGPERAGQQRRDREPLSAARPAALPAGHENGVASPGARGLALPRRPSIEKPDETLEQPTSASSRASRSSRGWPASSASSTRSSRASGGACRSDAAPRTRRVLDARAASPSGCGSTAATRAIPRNAASCSPRCTRWASSASRWTSSTTRRSEIIDLYQAILRDAAE